MGGGGGGSGRMTSEQFFFAIIGLHIFFFLGMRRANFFYSNFFSVGEGG